MQIKNDSDRCNVLREIIKEFYEPKRPLSFCDYSGVDQNGDSKTTFLLDRKFVVQYSIGYDNGVLLGVVLLAIGPIFFTAADFWSYEDSRKFKLDVDVEAVHHNLAMLDVFLKDKPLRAGFRNGE